MPDHSGLTDTTLSILDLAHLRQGGTAEEAFHNARTLAQRAESLGYKRFWLAEHHNIRGVACSATSVLIGHIANATSTIRVGSGGIMLPNHAPLAIAEQFGTLGSISASVAPPAVIGRRHGLSVVPRRTQEIISQRSWRSCAGISASHNLRSACMHILAKARTFPSGYWARVTLVRSWLENSVSRSRSPLISNQDL